jgi:mRNA-degrading endonuclease RelE of RelBE toxin-antitoxin system
MEILYSDRFKKDYKHFPKNIRKIIQDKLRILSNDPFHPSLRTKKIKGKEDIFESSVNMNIRITWNYIDSRILLRAIGEHDKAIKNP